MAILWERMTAMYPGLWVRDLGPTPVGEDGKLTMQADTWAKALAGLTGQQLAEGLRGCAARPGDFPPSVGSFRCMCLGIPSLPAVRRELANPAGGRSSFAVMVWQNIDSHAYRRAEGRAADRMLLEAYDEARDAVVRGQPLPDPVPALSQQKAPPPKPASPERVRSALDEIAATLMAMPSILPGANEPDGLTDEERARQDGGGGVDSTA
jgi:hypothetical protein